MKPYFKGLDTLRAVAALIVVIGHVEEIKNIFGIPNILHSKGFQLPDGHFSVVLFFVLSGFLITFLLIKEKQNFGKISLRDFYIRRVFRIMPLYFMVLFLSFVIFRQEYQTNTIILCATIFPNIAHALSIGWPTSPQIWSIGVEEQFYLLWPLLLILIPPKRVTIYLILFFAGFSLIHLLLGYANFNTVQNTGFNDFVYKFFYFSKFNSMALGSMLGYMCATNNKNLRFLFNNYVAYASVFLSFFMWFFHISFQYFNDEIYSMVFGVMIINLAANNSFKLHIDTKVSVFLGKISYGIYMYHWIIIMLLMKLIPYSIFKTNISFNIVIYSLAIILTICVSWVSYVSFEKYFLKLKERFTRNTAS